MNWPSIAHGIFKAGSNFRVGWWTGGVSFLFFKGFLQVLAGFSGWWGGGGGGGCGGGGGGGGGPGRWAIVLWGLYTLLKFPNFLSFKSFGNS